MPQVLLINPISREETKTMAKAKRSAAQQRATRKMIAANRAKRRGTAAAKPKRRPARTKARAARRTQRAANPAPAVRKRTRRTSKRDASTAGRTLRRRRSNPVGGVGGFIKNTMMPSAVGGAGALALDLVMNMLPLPPAMKSGPMRPVVKVVGAIGLGMLASKMASRQVGGQVAAGALTVTLYDMARVALAKNDMTKKLFGLGEYGVEDARVGEFVSEYVSGDEQESIGYVDSGMQVGDLMPDGSVEGYETGVYR